MEECVLTVNTKEKFLLLLTLDGIRITAKKQENHGILGNHAPNGHIIGDKTLLSYERMIYISDARKMGLVPNGGFSFDSSDEILARQITPSLTRRVESVLGENEENNLQLEPENTEAGDEADVETTEYTCPKCDKTYKTEKGLVKHVKDCKGDKHETLDNRDWRPTECPKCGKLYKTKKGFDRHVKDCTGPKPKKERVVMTDEEKALKRKEYVQRWVDKNETIQIRLQKGSDDLAFVEAQVAVMQETDEHAGKATYFRTLLVKAKKAAIKKGIWEKEVEA